MAWVVPIRRMNCAECGWRTTGPVRSWCPQGHPIEPVDARRFARYRVRWRDPKGDVLSRTFDRRDAAEDFARRVEVRLRDRAYVDPREGRVRLRELYERLHTERDYADATRALHAAIWRRVPDELRETFANEIDTARVEAFLATLRSTPVMQEKARSLLSTMFAPLVGRGIASSPVPPKRGTATRSERKARGSNGRRKRYLNDDELEALADAIGPRYRLLVILMGRMGLRPGEALALRVGKFRPPMQVPQRRLGRLVIDTALSGDTKTGEARELILPDTISEMLVEHTKGRPDEAPMFPKEDGSPIASKNAFDAWRRRHFAPAAERAGLGALSPNALRHTAAAWAISLGGTVYDVQRMLGHAKPSITLDVYGDLWDAQHADLVARQDEALSKLRQAAPVRPLPLRAPIAETP